VPPASFRLVAIAASAGGLTALTAVLSRLPATFPVPIVIVQHVDPNHNSVIADILSRRTALTVKQGIRLGHSELVHFVRPSADRLFETAAEACGPIIGVVLTGTGSDGAAGARAIKKAGGTVIAQDQSSSAFFGMPQAAIEAGAVDRVLPLEAIGPALVELTGSHDA
jgi:two-component system chemotaxis response regulator CheB